MRLRRRLRRLRHMRVLDLPFFLQSAHFLHHLCLRKSLLVQLCKHFLMMLSAVQVAKQYHRLK